MKRKHLLIIILILMLIPVKLASAQIWPFGGQKKAKKGGSMFGIVIGPSGQNQPGVRYAPIEGATVEARGTKGTFNTITDNMGGFQYNMIPPGDYTISINKPGFGSFIKQVTLKDAGLENLGHITLVPGGGLSTPQGVVVPDTVFVAFSKIAENPNGSMTSRWKKGAIQQGADPFALDGNKPVDYDAQMNPYDKGHMVSTFDNSLMTIDPQDSNKIDYIKLDDRPTWLCFNIAGTKLYVADEGNRVTVYDTLRNNINIGSVMLSSSANDITLSPDGKWLFVANGDGIVVVDTSQHIPVNTIEMPPMSDGSPGFPMAVACSPDGTKIYVALATASSGEVVEIDSYTKQPVGRAMVGATPTGIALSPNGSKLFVANHNSADVSVLSTSPLSVINRVRVGVSPARIAFAPNGSKAFVTCKGSSTVTVLDGNSGSNIGTINVGGEPMGVAVSGDNSRVYVANHADGTVSIIDANAGVELKRTRPQPQARPYGVVVKP